MDSENYQLRYLPLFFDDVKDAVIYIKMKLKSDQAAKKLIDALSGAILNRLPVCESFEPFHSKRERKYPYYRIYVKNYVIYYVVISGEGDKKIMEVRRLLHNRQNKENLL